jgi:acyl carrier protein
MEHIETQVRQFVVENFLFGEGLDKLKNEASFLESGVIDSTGVLELVTFLEDKFSIHVDDHELVPDNLDSINRIVHFVNRKKN